MSFKEVAFSVREMSAALRLYLNLFPIHSCPSHREYSKQLKPNATQTSVHDVGLCVSVGKSTGCQICIKLTILFGTLLSVSGLHWVNFISVIAEEKILRINTKWCLQGKINQSTGHVPDCFTGSISWVNISGINIYSKKWIPDLCDMRWIWSEIIRNSWEAYKKQADKICFFSSFQMFQYKKAIA